MFQLKTCRILLTLLVLLLPFTEGHANNHEKARSDEIWQMLEKSTWIQDGNPDAQRIFYVLTDPNCPYCNTLWQQSRPWVDKNKIQMRHIIVGMIHPSSLPKAVSLLTASNPSEALRQHEEAIATLSKQRKDAVKPDKSTAGIKPAITLPKDLVQKIEANRALSIQLGLLATPAMIWKGPGDTLSAIRGVPQDSLEDIFGPLQ